MMKSTPEPGDGPEPEEARPLSGRIEWDEASESFVLRYSSSWVARMRCECRFGLQEPVMGLALALSWPIALPVLAGTLILHTSEHASSLSIFEWGVRGSTPRLSVEKRWSEFKRLGLRGGDLFVFWRLLSNFTIPGCYFARECFADDDEARFCEEMLLDLWKSQGQNWSAARHRLLARETVRDSLRPNLPPSASTPGEPFTPFEPYDAGEPFV